MSPDKNSLHAAGMGRGFGLPNDDRPLSLRARHKVDKLQRISAAAIQLFGRDGFDGTTLRDIAAEAGVALGTLSLYAQDKRDLVLMIFNTVMPPLIERGRRSAKTDASLVDNMIAFFEPFYIAYAKDVTLYRVVLSQIHSAAHSVHAQESEAMRTDIVGHLSDIILRAISSGRCRPGIDPKLAAQSFFYLYFSSVRVWLFRDHPVAGEGLADLKALFELHAHGQLPQDQVI